MISKTLPSHLTATLLLSFASLMTANLSGCCTYGYNACAPYCQPGHGACPPYAMNACDPCQCAPGPCNICTPYEPSCSVATIPNLGCDYNPYAMPQSYSFSSICGGIKRRCLKAKRYVPTPKRPDWLTRKTFDPRSYLYSDGCSAQCEESCTVCTPAIEPCVEKPKCKCKAKPCKTSCGIAPTPVVPCCSAPASCGPTGCTETVDGCAPANNLMVEPKEWQPEQAPAPMPMDEEAPQSLKSSRSLSPALAQFQQPVPSTEKIQQVSHQFPAASKTTASNNQGRLLIQEEWLPASSIR